MEKPESRYCGGEYPKVGIAFFVSSHGFGHAARASAVMDAVFDRWPFVYFEIFTRTPDWFFTQSLKAPFSYHRVCTDIGLIQTSPFVFDLQKTVKALDDFIPFEEALLDRLAAQVHNAGCRMILCDISPLGIAVANKAKIPSVLIENFTWDWIYSAYLKQDDRFKAYIQYLREVFSSADHRVRVEPVCGSLEGAPSAPPISRPHRKPRSQIRDRLGLGEKDKTVLITLGGISEPLRCVDRLYQFGDEVHFIASGASPDMPPQGVREKNVTFLPHASWYYHPDLVNASDAVIGKLGYSTLAEVYLAGAPFGYIPRYDFRESAILESYIKTCMNGVRILEEGFQTGDWLRDLPQLLSLPVCSEKRTSGAGAVADFICGQLACAEEIIEIVDPEGRVVGAAPRRLVHGNNRWLHRVVHVLVFDNRSRLLLQKRSMDKDIAPGKWDTSVGGHVDCGETVEAAVLREAKEELGFCPANPRFAYTYTHSNPVESELVFTYVCEYNGNITFNTEEIDSVRFWEPSEIEAHMGTGALSDNFEDEFKRYRQWADLKT